MPLQPHQQRVVDEKRELDGKLVALNRFIGTPQERNTLFCSLPAAECERLHAQRRAMVEYSNILGDRIAAFE